MSEIESGMATLAEMMGQMAAKVTILDIRVSDRLRMIEEKLDILLEERERPMSQSSTPFDTQLGEAVVAFIEERTRPERSYSQ